MNWKILVAVAVILGTLGLLSLTEQGRQYAIFLGKGVGGLIGSVLKFSPGKTFNFDLTANKEAFYGQEFPLPDSIVSISGYGSEAKIGGKVWNLSSEKFEMEMTGSGDFALTADGKVSLNVDAKTFSFDGKKTTDVKVEVELVPAEFSLTNARKDVVNITSASGTLIKSIGESVVTSTFTKASLQIDEFSGLVELKNQTIKLVGTATDIKGI